MIITGVVEVKIRVAHQVNLDSTLTVAAARALLQRELEERVRIVLSGERDVSIDRIGVASVTLEPGT